MLVTETGLKSLVKAAVRIQYINKIRWFVNVFKAVPPECDKCNL